MSAGTSGAAELLLFGASTPAGAAFRAQAGDRQVLVLGRHCPLDWPKERFIPCDLTSAPAHSLPQARVIVSFAPLWHLAPFLAAWLESPEHRLHAPGQGPQTVVACSSSSVLTKRFAANAFDQALVHRLRTAEDTLATACQEAGLACRIVRPTLIYGEAGGYGDRNLSVLLRLMRRLPVLPVPVRTGLRQPIHAAQLAGVCLRLAEHPELAASPLDLGGDDTLPYAALLERLIETAQALDPRDRAARCRLLPVPTPLFHLLAAPLLIARPKQFEAVLRMQANLAGFTAAHTLLGGHAQPFPLLPLARH
ncbi:MAG: hypothetical protein ACKOZT_06235 [Cyanobium sp.]